MNLQQQQQQMMMGMGGGGFQQPPIHSHQQQQGYMMRAGGGPQWGGEPGGYPAPAPPPWAMYNMDPGDGRAAAGMGGQQQHGDPSANAATVGRRRGNVQEDFGGMSLGEVLASKPKKEVPRRKPSDAAEQAAAAIGQQKK